MKSYKCENCEEKQTSIIEATEGILFYELNLKDNSYEEKDHETTELEGYYCPNCHAEIPFKLAEKIIN